MKLKSYTLVTLLAVLLTCVLACQAGTFKPFVRSRYSLRWSKTTESSKVLDSTTSAPKMEADIPTQQSIKSLESTEKQLVQATTVQSILKTSTHQPDYDYYGNNEVEDNERTQTTTTN